MESTKVGIIICGWYHTCAGEKCFRLLQNLNGRQDPVAL